ncbi:type VI secretion system tip protein VgrG, partial [Myxococcus sp. RHST-1-4]|nr:type VI secretion system tip protein VgrG [Myxococcus sp. RHSTA-1-4]
GKNVTVLVTQGAMENVGAAKATTIGGGYSVNVALACNEATGGAKAELVAGLKAEGVGGPRQETVSGDKQLHAGGDDWVDVDGCFTLAIGKDWKVQAGEGLHLRVDEVHSVHARSFNLNAERFTIAVNGRVILQLEEPGRARFFGRRLTIEEK